MGGVFLDFLLASLNAALVLGGFVVQLPQIYKLLSTKNVEGLSEASWILQTFSTGFYCSYNYISGMPFMTWGDAFFAVTEYAFIVGLIWSYGLRANQISEVHGNVRKVSVFLALTTIVLTLTKKSPLWLTTLMGISPMPMVIAGRVPQILVNHKNKSAGQLSFASLLMQCAGNFARIISTLLLISDGIVLLSHTTAFVFNAIPLLQLIYFDILEGDLRNAKTQGQAYWKWLREICPVLEIRPNAKLATIGADEKAAVPLSKTTTRSSAVAGEATIAARGGKNRKRLVRI